jgi:hypothetical protein
MVFKQMIWTFSTFLVGIKGIVKRLMVLIKDGTPEEILKSEPLTELFDELSWLQNKVQSLELKKIQENSKLTNQIQSMKEELDTISRELKDKVVSIQQQSYLVAQNVEKSLKIQSMKEQFDNISRELQEKVKSLQDQQSYLVAQNAENSMKMKIQNMEEAFHRKNRELEKLTEVCDNKIKTLHNTFSAKCISDTSALQNLREMNTEMAKKIAQNNSNIPQPTSFKITISNLTNASFHHMLIMSFFVSGEKLPTHFLFKESPTQETLYATVCCFQIFFGLLFLIAFPSRKSNTAIQYFGIMIANCVVASLMCGLMHYILCTFTVLWWLVCLITVYGRISLDFKSEIASLFHKDEEGMTAAIPVQDNLQEPLITRNQ